MKILSANKNNVSYVKFKRKPANKEMKIYTDTITEGLNVLGKELGMIIHNSSVPSQVGLNIGIGSLLSKASEKYFMPFLKSHGMSKVMQDPNFKRKRLAEFSPYDPISASKNIYMIPLERLASDEYGNLLSLETLNSIVSKKMEEKNPNLVNYKTMSESFDIALNEVFSNFVKRQDVGSNKLLFEFEEFKKNKKEELEPDVIYGILSRKYGDENWKNWDDIDKYLYDFSENYWRIEELRKENIEEIEFFIFKQWLVEREIAKNNERNAKQGMSIIADTPVAFSPAEEWQNKDIFLEGIKLGLPADYYSKEGHRWGFAVLNPKKIFNQDGSLGKGGEFLRKRYEDIFKASPGGVRIDHLIGLIDPFVYDEKILTMSNESSGRLYSQPNHPKFGQYAKYKEEEYAAIFEKIIFPAAEKFGISKDNIICEDLGFVTDNVKRVINRLGLTGMSVTQYGYSGADAPSRNVIMLGGHDNKSYIEYTDELFGKASCLGEGRDRFIYKTHILAADTNISGVDENLYREELRNDKKKFMASSIAELFTSPAQKVQIFFTDFLGIGKTYNIPGTREGCWELRAPENYEDLYYKNLSNGLGVNLPEAIARAIRHKGVIYSKLYQNLLFRLDKFANILKEK